MPGHTDESDGLGRVFRRLLLLASLVVAPAAVIAEPPGAQATEAAMQALRSLHEETEEKYREVGRLSPDDQETALNVYVEQQMRRYLDLEAIVPAVYGVHWPAVVKEKLEAKAAQAALALMRNNIRAAFDNYERGSRLRLLRIQTDARSADQVWVSGTVGTPTVHGGKLPFSFIAKIHENNGRWLGLDLVFLGASLVGFARSDIETRVAAQGLEATIEEFAAQAVTDP